MTVSELIEKLKAFPPDMPVWEDGEYQHEIRGVRLGNTRRVGGDEWEEAHDWETLDEAREWYAPATVEYRPTLFME